MEQSDQGIKDFGKSEIESYSGSKTVPGNPFRATDLVERSAYSKQFDKVDTSTDTKEHQMKSYTENNDTPEASFHHWTHNPTAKSLDVDSFASLLLKGVASPVNSEQSSRSSFALPSFGISDQTSNSSNPSSYLGQPDSERESAESTEMKTPLTAYTASRLQQSRMPDKPKAPPPPKSRHGKTLSPSLKQPHVLSSDEFEVLDTTANETAAFRSVSDTLPTIRHDTYAKGAVHKQPGSYSSASLPHLVNHDVAGELKSYLDPGSGANLGFPTMPEAKKAPPPPVPLSRRSTVTRRPRANTGSSQVSLNEHGGSSYAASITESIDSSHKPAPPPPRRSGSSSTIPKVSDFTNDTASGRSIDARSALVSAFRPRSNSGASINSLPPPPPARRRSSRQSTELPRQNSFGIGSAPHSRRTSTDMPRSSFDGQRWPPSDSYYGASIAEESRVEASTSIPANNNAPRQASLDVLADMEAFQREIDAMRAKSS